MSEVLTEEQRFEAHLEKLTTAQKIPAEAVEEFKNNHRAKRLAGIAAQKKADDIEKDLEDLAAKHGVIILAAVDMVAEKGVSIYCIGAEEGSLIYLGLGKKLENALQSL